jgi:hypothetical protein
MKFLIIDSHKGTEATPQNLHWLNANKLVIHLRTLGHVVDFIWSHPEVNDTIGTGYDAIIFNHASRYSYISDEWIKLNPQAKLFYVTNEYNLGEPLILWSHVKSTGKQFDVIANHDMAASKVVKKYVNKWNIVNLNALIVENAAVETSNPFFTVEQTQCVYYGSFRKDRVKYFKKYFNGNIIISTHVKNRYKFEELGITGPFADRIDWGGVGLSNYKTSLYIEDASTHTNYNFLANRFYEALNYNIFPVFDASCDNTLKKSGYTIPDYALVDNVEELLYITKNLPESYTEYLSIWRDQALEEKSHVLHTITQLITS